MTLWGYKSSVSVYDLLVVNVNLTLIRNDTKLRNITCMSWNLSASTLNCVWANYLCENLSAFDGHLFDILWKGKRTVKCVLKQAQTNLEEYRKRIKIVDIFGGHWFGWLVDGLYHQIHQQFVFLISFINSSWCIVRILNILFTKPVRLPFQKIKMIVKALDSRLYINYLTVYLTNLSKVS